jgi:hypothetical protein
MNIELAELYKDAEVGALHRVSHYAKEAERCRKQGKPFMQGIYANLCKAAEKRAAHYASNVEQIKAMEKAHNTVSSS